jgi:hypothetical protein
MPYISDEIDELIFQLAASLHPPQHDAFIVAARTAVGNIQCAGPGSAYRVLAALQRTYWDPPIGEQGARDSTGLRPGKLANKPPIGRPWVRARRAG